MTANRGVCPLCRTHILDGQQAEPVDGRRWVHLACLITRQPMIGPHSGA
jgi:hypothetical protein